MRLSTATLNVAQLIVYGVGTPGVLHAVVVAYLPRSARWWLHRTLATVVWRAQQLVPRREAAILECKLQADCVPVVFSHFSPNDSVSYFVCRGVTILNVVLSKFCHQKRLQWFLISQNLLYCMKYLSSEFTWWLILTRIIVSCFRHFILSLVLTDKFWITTDALFRVRNGRNVFQQLLCMTHSPQLYLLSVR